MSRLDGFMLGHSSTGLYANDDNRVIHRYYIKGSFETDPSLDIASKTSELASDVSWGSIIGRTGRSRRRRR